MTKERIIYLFLLVAFGAVLVSVFRQDYNIQNLEKKRYWIHKTFDKEKYPLLFCGDSRVYRGISPEEVMTVLPEYAAYNLGYSSNGYHPEYLDFIEQRLDTSVQRPVIVLGLSSFNFSRRGSRSEHYRGEIRNRKKEEIIQHMYFYNLSRTFTPLDPLRTFSFTEKDPVRSNYKSIYHLDGWTESYWENPDSSSSIPSFEVIFNTNEFIPGSVDILLRRIEKWKAEGIELFAYRSPTTFAIRHLEDSLSGFDFGPFVEKLQGLGVHWIDLDQKRYDSYDGNHLDSESARLMSRDIALEIRQQME